MPETLDQLVTACAQRIPAVPRSFLEDRPVLGQQWEALHAAIRESDPRFAYEREGRPSALAAVRGALPSMEADLLDAIIEDLTCELAAYQEALYRLAASSRPAT
jgi:hypothetical protein